jgi:hypothetical protein
MDERRLRKFFHFTENDLEANRRGQLSEDQKKKLSAQAKAEQKSARDSATIVFVIAVIGLGLGLILTLAAPTPVSRVFFVLLLVILWPSVWAGRGIQILRAARASQELRLQTVNGRAHLIRHSDEDYVLQVGEAEFDLDGNPAGVIMEGDEYTVYYLETTMEILAVDFPAHGK